MSGKGGDTLKEQIARRVLVLFWSHGRAHWGAEVQLGVFVSGFKDGTKVKLSVYDTEDGTDNLLKDIDAKVDKGRAKGKYKLDFKDKDPGKGQVHELHFVADVDDKTIVTEKNDSPVLYCDLDPPSFSE
jgi:hypothetical protein